MLRWILSRNNSDGNSCMSKLIILKVAGDMFRRILTEKHILLCSVDILVVFASHWMRSMYGWHINQMILQEIVHFSMQRIVSHFKYLSASLWDVLEFLQIFLNTYLSVWTAGIQQYAMEIAKQGVWTLLLRCSGCCQCNLVNAVLDIQRVFLQYHVIWSLVFASHWMVHW